MEIYNNKYSGRVFILENVVSLNSSRVENKKIMFKIINRLLS